jgi:hypothetical protein
MNRIMSRRRLLSMSTIGAAGLLAACTMTTGGGSTTVTLDVAKIVTNSEAMLSALSAVLMVPTVIIALGVNYAAAEAALTAAQATLAEIEALTNGSITVTANTARLQALVTSLLNDAQTALALVQNVATALTGAVATQVTNAVSAILVLIPFVRMAAGFPAVQPVVGAMSEQQALSVLHQVRR